MPGKAVVLSGAVSGIGSSVGAAPCGTVWPGTAGITPCGGITMPGTVPMPGGVPQQGDAGDVTVAMP